MTTWTKEQHREYDAARYAKIRQYLDGIKGSAGCLLCGEKEVVCLDFHHLNPQEKSFNLSKVLRSQRKIANEVAKCIILCANCHRKLHANLVSLPT